MCIGLFEKILNGERRISSNFDPKQVWFNHYEFEDFVGKDKNHSQWYNDPNISSYDTIDGYAYSQIQLATSMFYPWRLIANETLYDSVYYAYYDELMFIHYPAYDVKFYNWTYTDLECDRFASQKMDYYDPRWRPFYK